MVVLNGHFDGRNVVLEEPVPGDIPANTPVKVVFEGADSSSVLAKIAQLAVEGGLPKDYAQQHEHYVKGAPRR
jgi:hypothetical protein